MANGRGTAIMRTGAGVITSVGLVALLIALLVVPAVPVLAATPTLDVSTYCDVNRSGFNWTTSSSNPTPDGGTADGAVHVTAEIEHPPGTFTTVDLGSGEYNDGNGYSFGGSYEVLGPRPVRGENTAIVQVTVTVDGFNDGSGQGSVVTSSHIFVNRCKDGSTTTSIGTTTTVPASISATVTAACNNNGGVVSYPITVSINGDEGATGTVSINGADVAYTIPASGQVVVAGGGGVGDNTVVVTDDFYGDILNEVIPLADCSGTTTTDGTTTTTDGTTTTTDGTTTTTDGTTTTTDGTTTTTDGTTTTTEGTTTTTEGTTTTTEGTTTTTEGTTTTTDPDGTTTTSDSSTNTSTPPVSVLPTVIEQTELPQTGIDNGPLALIGTSMLIGGAGLLIAARRREALSA